MAILNFVKPDKIVLQKANDFEAQFEFRPLEPGYGVTIGNALRRVLLNSLEGYAIVGINIVGADHEFATIKGITEDVTEIILNLKQVRFKKKVEHEVSSEKITLSIKNKTELTAGTIGEASLSFEVMNPELILCVMDSSAKLDIEITIGKTSLRFCITITFLQYLAKMYGRLRVHFLSQHQVCQVQAQRHIVRRYSQGFL